MSLNTLPDELICEVFSFLQVQDLANLALVDKKLNSIAKMASEIIKKMHPLRVTALKNILQIMCEETTQVYNPTFLTALKIKILNLFRSEKNYLWKIKEIEVLFYFLNSKNGLGFSINNRGEIELNQKGDFYIRHYESQGEEKEWQQYPALTSEPCSYKRLTYKITNSELDISKRIQIEEFCRFLDPHINYLEHRALSSGITRFAHFTKEGVVYKEMGRKRESFLILKPRDILLENLPHEKMRRNEKILAACVCICLASALWLKIFRI